MIALNKRTVLSLAVGIIFSAVALYFTFVNVPLSDLFDYMKEINYWWVIPSLLIAFLSYILRIWRWQIILHPVKKSGFWSVFHPMVIGFMLNCVFPGRVGEIARPAIYHKRENVEFTKVLATAGIERVFDALILLVFFMYILATVPMDPSISISFAGYHLTPGVLDGIWKMSMKISILLVAAVLFISIPFTRNLFNRAVLRSPDLLFFAQEPLRDRLRNGICRKITHIMDNFAVGFDIVKKPGILIMSLILSFVLWWLLGLSVYVLTFGYPGINVTFLEAFAMEIILCFFIMLPSVPGYWGLWEAGGVFALSMFGIATKEAAGFTLTYHFFHLIPVIIIGIVSALIIGIKFVKEAEEKPYD